MTVPAITLQISPTATRGIRIGNALTGVFLTRAELDEFAEGIEQARRLLVAVEQEPSR